jgi:hypothetical protein
MLEFVELLDVTDEHERWLVREDGALPHVAWFLSNEETGYLSLVAEATETYRGAFHPRIAAIRSVAYEGQMLRIDTDDDRGPTFAAAAAQLEDPIERERWAVAQVIAIADGLATMRQFDPHFVHRRLEPQRTFVDITGRVRLRAMIAYVEQGPRPARMGAGTFRGTPAFMSPEQASGRKLTAASDVFSLASNLYFALAGKRPFDRDDVMQELMAIIHEPPPPIVAHAPELQRVLARAFAKDPSERYATPGEFAGELWQCVPDAVDYDEVVSDRIVAWRATAPSTELGDDFETPPCKKQWGELFPTTNSAIRHCGECSQDVVRATSIAQLIPLVGRCVAYTGGD